MIAIAFFHVYSSTIKDGLGLMRNDLTVSLFLCTVCEAVVGGVALTSALWENQKVDIQKSCPYLVSYWCFGTSSTKYYYYFEYQEYKECVRKTTHQRKK